MFINLQDINEAIKSYLNSEKNLFFENIYFYGVSTDGDTPTLYLQYSEKDGSTLSAHELVRATNLISQNIHHDDKVNIYLRAIDPELCIVDEFIQQQTDLDEYYRKSIINDLEEITSIVDKVPMNEFNSYHKYFCQVKMLETINNLKELYKDSPESGLNCWLAIEEVINRFASCSSKKVEKLFYYTIKYDFNELLNTLKK